VRFLFGDGEMFHASGDDDELALVQLDVSIPQPDQQLALDDQKQFVFGIVVMPDKLALEFCQLDVRIVEFARDAGMPLVLKEIKLVREIDLFHVRFLTILTGAFRGTRLRPRDRATGKSVVPLYCRASS